MRYSYQIQYKDNKIGWQEGPANIKTKKVALAIARELILNIPDIRMLKVSKANNNDTLVGWWGIPEYHRIYPQMKIKVPEYRGVDLSAKLGIV